MTIDNPSEAGRKSSFEDLQYKNKHIIAPRDKKPYTAEMESSNLQYQQEAHCHFFTVICMTTSKEVQSVCHISRLQIIC